MALPYYRISNLVLICFLFFACINEDINDMPEINDFYYQNVAAFHADFNSVDYKLTVYLEFLDSLDNIESISGNIKDGNVIYYEFQLGAIDMNSKVYIHENNLIDENNSPVLPQDIYLYDLEVSIKFTDQSIYSFTNDLTTSIEPEIIEIEIPSIYQIDQTQWTILDLRLKIKDLNYLNNIEKVRYEIKRTLLNGCNVECIIDENCNQDIIEEDYISDQTWIFNYTESLSDTIFIYDEEILIRPIDGSAFYEGEELIFNETDCGRTGIIEFKFIVEDRDGLKDEIEGILLELVE
tara:strand:- start:1233 stop:2114 length:882 start_codon:yes stop_codon:yes gene_type:complete